ncbi:MAG: hypothetical protein FJZ09_00495 [Candidatus Omnitrophica bacterium]|nr:hypothetical protein [Candidatus Omnitrophota bacterium]
MENKSTCVVTTILMGAGILLLLAAAFDILPVADNVIIFVALACFVIGGLVKRIAKGGGGCCK